MIEAKSGHGKRRKTIRLASPRGFCAGVERAIRTVEDALSTFGAPVFVRHEIVHNAHVVRRLETMGAVFIEDLADADPSRPVIFSAHGAPAAAFAEARERALLTIDATCPLVLKVHNEVRRRVANGYHVLMIGHAGHPEVVGTMGQAPEGAVSLVDSLETAERVIPPAAAAGRLAYAMQTTLSIDDGAAIVAALTRRFPAIEGPKKSDICYATQNRQEAIRNIANGADLVLVVGSPQSSNSLRLVETAKAAGARTALLVDDPEALDLECATNADFIGISSGASTPEDLVERLIERLAQRFEVAIETIEHSREEIVFKSPLLKAS